MRSVTRISAAIVSSIALVASGLLGAGVASAAPGDVTEIGLAAGATPRDVAKGPDNNMWVTGGASKTIAKVTPEGAVTAYALPLPANVGNPWGIAAGPDGNMWFTLRDGGKIGRITMAGAVSVIDLPDPTMRPQDITAGPDGNMWFTELGGRIGRVTMAGAVSMFNVPWANSQPHSIVDGPEGSSRLYFTDAGADRIAYVLVDGTTYGSVPLATASDPTGIANVDGSIWFAMTARSQLGKLVADSTVLEMAVPGAPSDLTNGVGNTMWVSLSARNSVAKYSAQGAPLGEYTLTSPNSVPTGLAEGPGTNIWVAQTQAGKVARIVSGQVPVATASPTISPDSGSEYLCKHRGSHGSDLCGNCLEHQSVLAGSRARGKRQWSRNTVVLIPGGRRNHPAARANSGVRWTDGHDRRGSDAHLEGGQEASSGEAQVLRRHRQYGEHQGQEPNHDRRFGWP